MRFAGAAIAALLLAGCGQSSGSAMHSKLVVQQLTVSSAAFAGGGAIPKPFTCDGRDVSPPLRWSSPPAGTRELTIRMRDPDAPGGDFIHWSLSRIRPTTRSLAEGRAPSGAIQGRNSFGTVGYRGPCPPKGDEAHHYVITVRALGGGTVLASGTVVGTYARR